MIRYSKRTEIRRRRTMTAITAVVLASGFRVTANADAVPFIEYGDWASISDAVAVSRAAAGDPVDDYQWGDVIRLDVDNDGDVTQHDADLIIKYISMYEIFDAIYEMDIRETKDIFRMEMSERFNTPIQYCRVFYGFRPDEVVQYNPDCVMCNLVYTIADGGQTGYAIQEDPYTGDVLYNNTYNTGDVVIIFNVFTAGDPTMIQVQDEIKVGNVSDLGFEYSPRPEIVQRALANDDFM